MPSLAGAVQDNQARSILVTGATTGIGRNLAEALAGEGYHVYAGARTDSEMAELSAIKNMTAVRLDVTKQDQIDAAVAMIRNKDTGLYGLVNNAGIGGGGPVLETAIEDQTKVYQVNVEGVYRITKAFAPLIIESKGRITTTGSVAGTISNAGFNAYSGSKHWIEAFTDALADEMSSKGVAVSVIEPGNYQTHIRRNTVLAAFAKVTAAGGEINDDMQKMYDRTEAYELSFKKPDEVTEAFMHALFDDEPLRRYMVTPSQRERDYAIGVKVQQLVELNHWGPHRYSRDQLVEMLDKTLAASAK
ncbi:SDR family NAD(P)-dependent oxidoreductase [Porticoccaceae bacterium]|nr:SDR family NAD(P)-dependent oxidoreductase [Porticoccaceae bacterium]